MTLEELDSEVRARSFVYRLRFEGQQLDRVLATLARRFPGKTREVGTQAVDAGHAVYAAEKAARECVIPNYEGL